ncbi:MAG: DUF4091 domain-containing protein [Clostridia bacterium]|nr:DUF4091 domain-containing protein [Clostridia bacterium]
MQVRVISPLEKVFADENLQARQVTAFSGFQNECISFQLAVCGDESTHTMPLSLRAESTLAEHIRIRSVRSVPVRLAAPVNADDNYLRKTPGLYPDLLRDIIPDDPSGDLFGYAGQWQCFWIDVEPEGFAAGEYPVHLTVYNKLTGAELAKASAQITVLPGMLPKQSLKRTSWFHSDCLAQYYGVEVFSEEYWRIVENFVSCAAKRGYNMLLTPLFTPPLDTQVGGERLTVQLVDVTVRSGEYAFGFEKFRRWVRLAQRCGMEYFEMSHLFTQWGAKHAPKIMAEADGVCKRIFGWETEATSEAYARFLRCFLPRLMEEIKGLGIKEKTYFHISDEPRAEMMDDYRAARALVAPYVEDCVIMDALSDYAFYASGAVTHPIPAINHMDPFLENKVPDLWTYYCVSQYKDVTNLFIAMPSPRTRMLGVQLYKYDLAGFLQWGFNFYNSFWSTHSIDPYHTTDADGRFPAGDPLQVYPGRGGMPEESVRLMVLHQAMQDLRALRWLESLIGREKTLNILQECAKGELTLTAYPKEGEFFERLRGRINAEIIAKTQM